uniref:Uncharacterized protein n=1 Tax=Talaromyces marneffei PM1 TaxID=1077442 RepID=A0A093W245_TALMA
MSAWCLGSSIRIPVPVPVFLL